MEGGGRDPYAAPLCVSRIGDHTACGAEYTHKAGVSAGSLGPLAGAAVGRREKLSDTGFPAGVQLSVAEGKPYFRSLRSE